MGRGGPWGKLLLPLSLGSLGMLGCYLLMRRTGVWLLMNRGESRWHWRR
jgi:hypothetical protein